MRNRHAKIESIMTAHPEKTLIKCPQCRKPTAWQENPFRPFCSERCQLVDLGRWADEDYRIAGPATEVVPDDNRSDSEEQF